MTGNRLLVGAPNDSTFGADSGAVYVFTRSGSAWVQEAKLRATDAGAGKTFGQSVAVSGSSAVIGSAGGGSDSVYSFVKTGSAWEQKQKIFFDPNSDFVKLHRARDGVDPAIADALADRGVRVLRPGTGPDALRVRFVDMSPRAKAAILRLDPVVNRGEYNAPLRMAPALQGVDHHGTRGGGETWGEFSRTSGELP